MWRKNDDLMVVVYRWSREIQAPLDPRQLDPVSSGHRCAADSISLPFTTNPTSSSHKGQSQRERPSPIYGLPEVADGNGKRPVERNALPPPTASPPPGSAEPPWGGLTPASPLAWRAVRYTWQTGKGGRSRSRFPTQNYIERRGL